MGSGGGNLPRARGKGSWAGKSRGNSLDSQRPAFAFFGKRRIRDGLFAILQYHIAHLLEMIFS
jgi:hypothetical protein